MDGWGEKRYGQEVRERSRENVRTSERTKCEKQNKKAQEKDRYAGYEDQIKPKRESALRLHVPPYILLTRSSKQYLEERGVGEHARAEGRHLLAAFLPRHHQAQAPQQGLEVVQRLSVRRVHLM